MSAAAGASYLPQDLEFLNMYSAILRAAEHASGLIACQSAEPIAVEPSAPPMDGFDQIIYFLVGKIQYEWPQDELDQMATLWRQITGYEMLPLLESDQDIPNLIKTLQVRESGLVRMYHQSSDGNPVSRTTMMELHAKFSTEYGFRITEFTTNQSFNFIVDNHIQAQFV